jgi:ribose/xylose/arabinose/galactoside ABC-type transport system permease subunit
LQEFVKPFRRVYRAHRSYSAIGRALGRFAGGRNTAILIALGMWLTWLAINTQYYFTYENLKVVAQQQAIYGIIALGTTFLLISGYVDLSIGSMFGLCAVVASLLAKEINPQVAIAIGIAVGGLCGLMDGLAVWRFRYSPIIITLGSLFVYRALAELFTGGAAVYDVPNSFAKLGRAAPLGVDVEIFIVAGLAFLAYLVLSKTTIGRHICAIGGNAEAAELVGLNSRRLIIGAFAAGGLLAGLAGVLTASRFGSSDPAYGQGLELDVITGVILGGVAFTGGEGTIGGVMLGIIFLGTLNSGFIALGWSPYYADIVKGTALIAAIGVDQIVHERREHFRKLMAMKE